MLEALTRVFADPHALVDAISLSDSELEAIASLQSTFSLSAEQARVVMDQRFSLMTRSKVVSLEAELAAEPRQ